MQFAHETTDLIAKAVAEGKNVLVAGPTGSGKTTLLDAILGRRKDAENAVVIETLPELHIRPSDRHLTVSDGVSVMASIRGIPPKSRAVLGELRDQAFAQAAFHFIRAGIPCMTTIHANTPEKAWSECARLAGEDLEIVKRSFAVVVVMEQGQDGQRRPKTSVGI